MNAALYLIPGAILAAIFIRVVNAPPVLEVTKGDMIPWDHVYPGRLAAQAGGAKQMATGDDRHVDDDLASLVVGEGSNR